MRISGIATLTRQFVGATDGTSARIYDTRKTTPGWRRLEKYAVRCGGGNNHRTGLFDAVLIKDNHLAIAKAAGMSPGEAVERARELIKSLSQNRQSPTPLGSSEDGGGGVGSDQSPATDTAAMVLEIEVDSLEQLEQVLPARPDIVLLDNMSCVELEAAAAIRDRISVDVDLEASGGVNLKTVREIAETGVDRISVGALTHSAITLDLGLDWEKHPLGGETSTP